MANNPMFNEAAFERAKKQQTAPSAPSQEEAMRAAGFEPRYQTTAYNTMTLQGTVNKTFVLLLLCVITGAIGWTYFSNNIGVILISALGAFGLGLWTSFQPKVSPFTSPIYAALEGIFLGTVSATYNAQYPGIVASAVGITFLVFAVMLFIYKTGIIKVTQGFITAIVSATAAIAIFYVVSFVLALVGVDTSYLTSSSPLSIGISVVICIVAALNLMLDFEFINRMTSRGDAPKFMEWYAGFGLLLTIVWLYIEILKLLAKSKRR